MKKIFSTILVLGFLLSGNAFAENIYLSCSRIVTENNGEGDWSRWQAVGNDLGNLIIEIKKKNKSLKIVVHLAENDSGEPEKMFKGKGLYKDGHYTMKKKHSGKTYINTWMLKDYGVTSMKASDKIDISKIENEWIINGTGIRKYKSNINVNYNYNGECNSLSKEKYSSATSKSS
tara:strand:- start:105 stop:629 length:525 start_codon:yes stop_codon:yes gene_type:complete